MSCLYKTEFPDKIYRANIPFEGNQPNMSWNWVYEFTFH